MAAGGARLRAVRLGQVWRWQWPWVAAAVRVAEQHGRAEQAEPRRADAARRARLAWYFRAPPPRRRGANFRKGCGPRRESRGGRRCLEPGVVFVSYEGNPDITPIAEPDA